MYDHHIGYANAPLCFRCVSVCVSVCALLTLMAAFISVHTCAECFSQRNVPPHITLMRRSHKQSCQGFQQAAVVLTLAKEIQRQTPNE